MSTVVCLLGYSLAVLLAGPPVLRRLTAGGHAPRLGAAAWLTAIISVLASWVAAAAITIVELVRHWGHLDRLIVSCLMWLCRAASGAVDSTAQAVVIGALAAAGAGAAIAAVRVVRAAGLLRHRAREHARDVRLVGRATADADVVVIDAPQPAAYCVTGRPGAIVFTSAALAALDDRQRAAVLAHERAHLAGHHLTVMVGMRALARVFPRLLLITEGVQQVSRLLEMCADDVAVRDHGARALLSGLIALCGAAPAEALGAADVAVLDRAARLTEPAGTGLAARAGLAAALVTVIAGPLFIAALAASGTALCMG